MVVLWSMRAFTPAWLVTFVLPSNVDAQQRCYPTYSGFATCLTEDGWHGTIYYPWATEDPWVGLFDQYDFITGEPCYQIEPLPFFEEVCEDIPPTRTPPANPVVIGLTGIWKRAEPWKECVHLGSDWWPLTWDGNAEILYCKRLSGTVPETAVVNVAGLWAGRRTPPPACASLGPSWSPFYYDGKANMNLCMELGPTANGYIRDMTAVWRNSCRNALGENWTGVIWNGNAQIEFCADFN
jgi:hypothetical protein